MKTIRRVDRNKVHEIKKFIETCKDANISPDDITFAEYKAIADATRLEHASANYPLFTQDKELRADVLKLHNMDVRKFNKSLKDMDMEIVAVAYEIQDVHGNKMKIYFDQLAEGVKAKQASEKCDAYIKGWKNKKARLTRMAEDTELKSKHDAKLRAIQRIIRKGKK